MRWVLPVVALPLLAAVEPDLTITADLTALREEAPVTAPTRAWAGDPAWAALRAQLERFPEAGLPPVLAVLDAATSLTLSRAGATWATAAPGARADWGDWAARLPVATAAPGTDPLAWRWEARTALLRLDQAGYELPMTGWRGADATLAGTWTVTQGTWTATTRLTTAAGLGLRPVDVSGVDEQVLVGVAANVDPQLLAAVLSRNLLPGHRNFLEERLGASLPVVASRLRGDLLLRVEAGEVLPVVSLALGLQPGQDGTLLVTALADSFRGQGTTCDGALRATRLDTPVGPWFAAANQRWLVLGNDPARLTELLARPDPVAGPLVLKVRADLPTLDRRFLPLALAAWRGTPLVEDPLPDLAARLEDVALAQAQAGKSVAEGLAPGADLAIKKGAITRHLRLSEVTRARLGTLLGAHPDDAVAVYAPLSDEDTVQLVLRTEAGWVVVTDLRRGFDRAVPAEAATRRLRDLGTPRLVLGRPLADLDPITPPPVPRLDRTCVPAPEVLAPALTPYTAELRLIAGGAVLEERGLPLLNTALLGLAVGAQRLPEAPPRSAPAPTTEF